MKKNKIIILLLTLLFPLNVFASTTTYNRNDLNNLGVNKHWNITDTNRKNVLASKKVDASEKVYDFAEIFTEQEEKQIFDKIQAFKEANKTEIVVLTDKFNYNSDHENEDYAVDFYDYNDFGLEYEKYDGIIIFINMNESDRYVNFYMFGNSQLYFDNHRKNEPINYVLNYMKRGDYAGGVLKYISLFETYYQEGIPYDLEGYYVDNDGYLQKDPNFVRKKPPFKAPWGGIIGADISIVFITLLILIKKNKMVKKKLVTMDYADKKSFHLTKETDRFVRSYVTSHTRTSSSGGGHSGGGYSSSHGSSGGGHSSGSGGHF